MWCLSTRLIPCAPSLLLSRRVLAGAMLALVLETVCVLGRAPRPVEPRTPDSDAALVLGEGRKVDPPRYRLQPSRERSP